jgi:hypothetical protein
MKQAAEKICGLLAVCLVVAGLTAALRKKRGRMERNNERLCRIVGKALVQEASKYPDFKAKLIDALDVAVTDEKARRFLADHGWR